MLSTLIFIAVAVASVVAHDCTETRGECPKVIVDKDFQLSQMTGAWYLVATSYELHGHNDSCTEYKMTANGNKLVGTKSFKYDVNGQAATLPGEITLLNQGLISLKFNEPEHKGTAEEHSVLLHDDDVIVLYGCTEEDDDDHHHDHDHDHDHDHGHCLDILVLSKEKEISPEVQGRIINKLRAHGVTISKFYTGQQTGC